MLRNFTNVVNEVIEEAYQSGIDLFLENLEEDLNKDNYIQEHGLEKTLENLLTEDNDETSTKTDKDIVEVE
jgi:hypothetical protein